MPKEVLSERHVSISLSLCLSLRPYVSLLVCLFVGVCLSVRGCILAVIAWWRLYFSILIGFSSGGGVAAVGGAK